MWGPSPPLCSHSSDLFLTPLKCTVTKKHKHVEKSASRIQLHHECLHYLICPCMMLVSLYYVKTCTGGDTGVHAAAEPSISSTNGQNELPGMDVPKHTVCSLRQQSLMLLIKATIYWFSAHMNVSKKTLLMWLSKAFIVPSGTNCNNTKSHLLMFVALTSLFAVLSVTANTK